ncbi:MAG: hypothetical protein ICV76_01525 [Nitrospiraceae bacterium]|nr:hypothetical protein [Nitrospiraceae bacterium]
MTPTDARAQFNYLMTLCIRKAEAFGPLALAFLKEHNVEELGLTPEEQFNLFMATAEAFAEEPKRYNHKLECLQKAAQVLQRTQYADPDLTRHLHQEIQKTTAEWDLYNDAMRAARSSPMTQALDKHRIIVETDLPDYFLQTAPKRAAAYFQNKFKLTKEAKVAQNFSGPTRKFEPENIAVHKEFAGACAPFMSARTTALHLMLPFDLKISRTPVDPLEGALRIWYATMGYSFPLRYEMGKLCSFYDDTVLDISLDDPSLLFVSVSPVKESEVGVIERSLPDDVPPDIGLARAFLDGTNSLGPYIQIACNFRVWFDSAAVSLLIQGAPDLHEYGLQGAAGLLTRTYATENVHAYAPSAKQPWQEGLSFNFVNMHLQLLPGVTTAMVPYSTPIFSVFPVLNRQSYRFEDRRHIGA